jgi:hypothetical protein
MKKTWLDLIFLAAMLCLVIAIGGCAAPRPMETKKPAEMNPPPLLAVVSHPSHNFR